MGHAERRIRRALHLSRSSVRYAAQPRADEAPLTGAIIELASQYGRYGYRRIHAMLEAQGWELSRSRVERIWKLEGLKVPVKQPKRGRLWLADGSCIRMRPEYANHVRSWDFVMERTQDGRVLKILVLIDEFTRRCLALHVARKNRSNDVIDILAEAMVAYGVPAYLRSDNGPEMVAKNLRRWLASVGSKRCTLSQEAPGRTDTASPSTANSAMNLLNGEIVYTLREAQVIIERWRPQYNTVRPHSSLKYRPPATAGYTAGNNPCTTATCRLD
ncbi:transposase InsO family protein [Herbaspirillum sp. 1173]|nr:transposase InsO family protein [Herbaspirillum sp. 1173]